MPAPQFTLRRLLIGVTLFCVAMGLVAMFPTAALASAYSLLLWSPAVGIAAWVLSVSKNRSATLVVLLAGAVIGSIPPTPSGRSHWFRFPNWWEPLMLDIIYYSIPMTIAVAVAAGIDRAVQSPHQAYEGPPKRKRKYGKISTEYRPTQKDWEQLKDSND